MAAVASPAILLITILFGNRHQRFNCLSLFGSGSLDLDLWLLRVCLLHLAIVMASWVVSSTVLLHCLANQENDIYEQLLCGDSKEETSSSLVGHFGSSGPSRTCSLLHSQLLSQFLLQWNVYLSSETACETMQL